jgi:hypothetical protein
LDGQFCSSCGQNQKGFNRFFFSLVSEAYEDVFATDSRAWQTLVSLLLRPGFLTKEYFQGRRARYVQPLRLYFITSLLFFTILSLENALTKDEIEVHPDATEMHAETEQTDEKISDGVELDFLNEEELEALKTKIEQQVKKFRAILENDPGRIGDWILDVAPTLMFCLLPVLALLIKIVYITSGRYYTEHLVLAVHNHCFIYITMVITGFLDLAPDHFIVEYAINLLQISIGLWIPVYLLLSLRTTYGGGWLISTFKFFIILISYSFLFLLMILITGLIGFMTL